MIVYITEDAISFPARVFFKVEREAIFQIHARFPNPFIPLHLSYVQGRVALVFLEQFQSLE